MYRPQHQYYPKWVYSKNEDTTRRNMEDYDNRYAKARQAEIDRGYVTLPIRERRARWNELKEEFGV